MHYMYHELLPIILLGSLGVIPSMNDTGQTKSTNHNELEPKLPLVISKMHFKPIVLGLRLLTWKSCSYTHNKANSNPYTCGNTSTECSNSINYAMKAVVAQHCNPKRNPTLTLITAGGSLQLNPFVLHSSPLSCARPCAHKPTSVRYTSTSRFELGSSYTTCSIKR